MALNLFKEMSDSLILKTFETKSMQKEQQIRLDTQWTFTLKTGR